MTATDSSTSLTPPAGTCVGTRHHLRESACGCRSAAAEGENAHFRTNVVSALDNAISVDDLDPKLVHAYVTGLMAKNYNFVIHTDETQENLITLLLKTSVVS